MDKTIDFSAPRISGVRHKIVKKWFVSNCTKNNFFLNNPCGKLDFSSNKTNSLQKSVACTIMIIPVEDFSEKYFLCDGIIC